MELIPSRPDDLDDFIRSFEHSEVAQYYFPSNDRRKDTFNEFVHRQTALTACVDDRITGFVCYLPHGAFHGFPYLHVFTVMEEYRGQGYGTEILDAFERGYLGEASKVFLVVADFNLGAQSFYERNGFVRVGHIPGLYRQGTNENLMMKILR